LPYSSWSNVQTESLINSHSKRRGPVVQNREGAFRKRAVARRRSRYHFGFEKEDDALQWIKEKSQASLLEQET
jgi:hypothetical protein